MRDRLGIRGLRGLQRARHCLCQPRHNLGDDGQHQQRWRRQRRRRRRHQLRRAHLPASRLAARRLAARRSDPRAAVVCSRRRRAPLRCTGQFCSSAGGIGLDNPKDPKNLNEMQKSKAVSFFFRDFSKFDVSGALTTARTTALVSPPRRPCAALARCTPVVAR